jgi:RNA-directed DNA polymerase
MKRLGNLFEKIYDLKNLELAYYKASRGKKEKESYQVFSKQLFANLQILQNELKDGNYTIGQYHFFTIYDPKKRLICAAPFKERVLHHAIMNVCHQTFEKKQIYDSYATRPNKGTFSALKRAYSFHKRNLWFLKLDFRKYFDSIDHGVLKNQLREMFKDKKLLNLFDTIIDSYSVTEGKGVPIGNLTSQYFANHYLTKLDHLVKEKFKLDYVRYMDDMILWSDDKEKLLEIGNEFSSYAKNILVLTLKPFCLNRQEKGCPFLGFLLYPDKINLALRSRTRFIKKIRIYDLNLKSEIWSETEYQNHVLPLLSFVKHANSREFRVQVLKRIDEKLCTI